MNYLSVDIETMDTKRTAVVLSIGLAAFNTLDGVFASTTILLRRNPQMRWHGRTVDLDTGTMDFWLSNREASKIAFPDDKSDYQEPPEGLRMVAEFWDDHNCFWAVGNGVDFDLGILESLADSMGVHSGIPWNHRRTLCLKTLRAIRPNARRVSPKIPHHPEYDAIAQAESCRNILIDLGDPIHVR